jgi:hypothetical protein|tara:strand:+ start:111 stop:266 length:156 start_codon:yes stop_codon:yes gene_type:complete
MFEKIREHVGHEIEAVTYGWGDHAHPVAVAIECVRCHVVIVDADAAPEVTL